MTPTPGTPVEISKVPIILADKILYTITYKMRGRNPYPMFKHVYMDSRLSREGAINRARKHCENTGSSFLSVYPFISDMEKEESIYLGHEPDASTPGKE